MRFHLIFLWDLVESSCRFFAYVEGCRVGRLPAPRGWRVEGIFVWKPSIAKIEPVSRNRLLERGFSNGLLQTVLQSQAWLEKGDSFWPLVDQTVESVKVYTDLISSCGHF